MSLDGQRFCLKWNDFRTSVTAVFDDLRQDEELVDITLCCEGKKVKAHRMMLSACSPYFRELLKENPCQHPVFFLKDTTFADLRAVIEFVYNGEVNVTQGQLSSFLKTAEMLQVRGLTGDDEKDSAAPAAAAPTPLPRVPPPMPPQQRAYPVQPPRRPSMSPQHQPAMRLPPTPVKRPLPPVQPPIQTTPRRLPPTQPPVSNDFIPEVVTMPDSPPPPAVSTPAAATAGAAELPADASPASKRRRHSGSSGGEGPATPAGEPVPSPSPAASPAGTSSDAPLASPAPAAGLPLSAAGPPPPPPPPPPAAPELAGAAQPLHDYTGHHQQQQSTGMVKVEKVDVDIGEEDEGLSALGDMAHYEGSYDSDQSLGAMPMTGDPSQGGGAMYVPGPSEAGAGAGPLLWPLGGGSGAGGRGGQPLPQWRCDKCHRQFRSSSAFSSHQAVHRGLTTCPICMKMLSRLEHLKRHMTMTHDMPPEHVAAMLSIRNEHTPHAL